MLSPAKAIDVKQKAQSAIEEKRKRLGGTARERQIDLERDNEVEQDK